MTDGPALIDQFDDPDGKSTRAVAEAFKIPLPATYREVVDADDADPEPELEVDAALAELLAGEPAHLAPKPVQPVEPSPREVRQGLRDALAALDVAAARARSARTALARGTELLGEVDAAIAERREAERAAREADGEQIARSLSEYGATAFALPAARAVDLAGVEAERHREAIVAAHDKLAADLVRAEGEAEGAAHRVDQMMAQVVRSEAHVLAAEVAELERRAAEKRTLLAYSLRRIAAPGRYSSAVPVSLSRLAGEVIHGQPVNATVAGSGPAYDRAVAVWNAYPERLIRNPEYRLYSGEM
jgi:hypothetical protein